MPIVTVASFNAHFGVDIDGRPFDVTEVCAGFDADVIALQEVWCPRGEPSQAAQAADQLGYKVHEVPLAGATRRPRPRVFGDLGRGEGIWGLAVLSRLPSSVLPALPAVPLGRVPGDPARRAVLAVEVDAGDLRFTVACTHLTHRLYGSLVHLARLRAVLGALPGPGVAMGDMNMWGPVVSSRLPGWRRAVRGRTWPAHRPHSQIDHVLAGPGVEVLDGEVLGPVGSDHRPVRATLRLAAV